MGTREVGVTTEYDRIQLATYTAELARLEVRLAELDLDREALRNQIENTKQIVANLQKLCGVFDPNNVKVLGFTDAVRAIFRLNRGKELNAIRIRNALVEKGYDLSTYSNAMSSLYTVLERLSKTGEIDKVNTGLLVTYIMRGRRPRIAPRRRNATFYGEPGN